MRSDPRAGRAAGRGAAGMALGAVRFMARSLAMVLIGSLTTAAGAAASVNGHGILVLHAEPSLVYTTSQAGYCGLSRADACSTIVDQVPAEPGHPCMVYVLAVIPDSCEARIRSVSFGLDYNSVFLKVTVHGGCGDREMPMGGWPGSGTGTTVSWDSTQVGHITEAYWFEAYSYVSKPSALTLTPNPLNGGIFLDDAHGTEEIAGYGSLGFGQPGTLPACSGTRKVASPAPAPPSPAGRWRSGR